MRSHRVALLNWYYSPKRKSSGCRHHSGSRDSAIVLIIVIVDTRLKPDSLGKSCSSYDWLAGCSCFKWPQAQAAAVGTGAID